ncbi:MAG: GNAT family N-acetyltransferase [bacterium]|nr:GNAT family N-acetyltransferase [bacterium]
MIVTETSRLILRELTPSDADFMYRLNLDPEVIKYTGDKPFDDIDAARLFLENYDHYQKYGFGRWAVLLKEDQSLIGWCGLKYDTVKDEFDVGFRFFREHWSKGYATEAAGASINLGFKRFQIATIVGRAMSQNLASINVLQKLGMKYWKVELCGQVPGVVYRMNNPY